MPQEHQKISRRAQEGQEKHNKNLKRETQHLYCVLPCYMDCYMFCYMCCSLRFLFVPTLILLFALIYVLLLVSLLASAHVLWVNDRLNSASRNEICGMCVFSLIGLTLARASMWECQNTFIPHHVGLQDERHHAFGLRLLESSFYWRRNL